ncbi:hypothetical protein [Microvirga puerhi]|uniref:Uncharacterized protein n=1 Tax=Microvirga puerhi TaxID=2876078 RepID=A0ABS7VTI7_9HYPH|nr:hypothetical protein [Microvirga puerhi]MBZ6078889.1 hypothetical protein [Microvirga puerhi]MBZ6078964.1 hypothetical protein [Microvirga puerhi]
MAESTAMRALAIGDTFTGSDAPFEIRDGQEFGFSEGSAAIGAGEARREIEHEKSLSIQRTIYLIKLQQA